MKFVIGIKESGKPRSANNNMEKKIAMKIMSILIVFLSLIFIYRVFLILVDLNRTKDLGRGYEYIDYGFAYWQFIDNEIGGVVPVKVVEFKFDEKYIIAVRVIVELYECYPSGTVEFNSANSSYNYTFYGNAIEYWIIDKTRNIAFMSQNIKKVEERLSSLDTSLTFRHKSYKKYIEQNLKDDETSQNDICILDNNISKYKSVEINPL